MRRGILVSFEGQDACGKSTLIKRLNEYLNGLGYKTKVVDEFSNSEIGKAILKKLLGDKFLRSDKKLGFSDSMNIITDLYYLQEAEINPALSEGCIVLKDRHIDTIFACEIPKLKESYPEISIKELFSWLNETTKNVRRPDKTFLLKIPREIQYQRIKGRGEEVLQEDIKIFDKRDKIYSSIIDANKDRISVLDNNMDIELSVKILANEIIKRYRELSKKSTTRICVDNMKHVIDRKREIV